MIQKFKLVVFQRCNPIKPDDHGRSKTQSLDYHLLDKYFYSLISKFSFDGLISQNEFFLPTIIHLSQVLEENFSFCPNPDEIRCNIGLYIANLN